MESGIIYGTLIDPILKPMRKRVAKEIQVNSTIIDIACGTGAQIFALAKHCAHATGIDLSESMIEYAKKTVAKKDTANVEFHICDATNLSQFKMKKFDFAILSLALHQFTPELHSIILNEIKQVATRLILLDYRVPLPKNYAGYGSHFVEFLAGKEHNKNFKKYYHLGGLNKILLTNNFQIEKSVLFAKGAFQLVVCSPA